MKDSFRVSYKDKNKEDKEVIFPFNPEDIGFKYENCSCAFARFVLSNDINAFELQAEKNNEYVRLYRFDIIQDGRNKGVLDKSVLVWKALRPQSTQSLYDTLKPFCDIIRTPKYATQDN